MAKLLVAAYGLLVIAWLVTNPPGLARHQPSNDISALAVGSGQFFGASGTYPAARGISYRPNGRRLERANLVLPLGLGLQGHPVLAFTLVAMTGGGHDAWVSLTAGGVIGQFSPARRPALDKETASDAA